MNNIIFLKDIVHVLNEPIEIYYKGSFVGEFAINELKETEWMNDKVCSIDADEEQTLCVYLTTLDRMY